MRSRNIKPGFFKNEQLAECSFAARLIFPGLWMLADRAGRMEYRPRRIKAELLPFDNVDIVELLGELEREKLIIIYNSGGIDFLWIPGFKKHQVPHIKEKQSELPRCELEIEVLAPYKHSASTVQEQCQHPLIPDSLNLIPEHIVGDCEKNDNGDGKKQTKPKKFNPETLKPACVSTELWSEFVENRKFKKLQNTETALKAIMASFEKGTSQYSYTEMITEYVSSRMQRFDPSWMKKGSENTPAISRIIRCSKCHNEHNSNCINRTDEQRLKCTYFEAAVAA